MAVALKDVAGAPTQRWPAAQRLCACRCWSVISCVAPTWWRAGRSVGRRRARVGWSGGRRRPTVGAGRHAVAVAAGLWRRAAGGGRVAGRWRCLGFRVGRWRAWRRSLGAHGVPAAKGSVDQWRCAVGKAYRGAAALTAVARGMRHLAQHSRALYTLQTQQIHSMCQRNKEQQSAAIVQVETHYRLIPLATASQLGSRCGGAAHAAPPVLPPLALCNQLRGQLLRQHVADGLDTAEGGRAGEQGEQGEVGAGWGRLACALRSGPSAANGSVAVPVRCRPHTALRRQATAHHNQRHTHAYVIMGLRPVGVGKHEPSAQYSPATCDSKAGCSRAREWALESS